jgi:hypothetical protein
LLGHYHFPVAWQLPVIVFKILDPIVRVIAISVPYT